MLDYWFKNLSIVGNYVDHFSKFEIVSAYDS
jgi:hypothetical protein